MSQVWSATHIDSNLSGGGTTTVTQTATSTNSTAYGSVSATTGKFYCEFNLASMSDGTGNTAIGLANTATTVDWIGNSTDSIGLYFNTTYSATNCLIASKATGPVLGLVAPISTDRLAMALDCDNNLLWFKNVTQATAWYGAATSGNPSLGASGNGFSLTQTGLTVTSSPVVPAITLYYNGETGTGYFLPSSWLGTAPAGFAAFDSVPVYYFTV